MKWHILYRGPLSSCNYDCSYCPFGKTKNTKAELAEDAKKLTRFIHWVKSRKEEIEILFAPWGEALIKGYYQKAMTTLSHFPNVKKVTIQTNLTCNTSWMNQVNKESFSLWTTFHPSQTSLDKFTKKSQQLDALGIRYTVGFVALKEDLKLLEALRAAINPKVYVWANAYKRIKNYYTQKEIKKIVAIDPLFNINNQVYDSLGKSCQAGHTSFSVDGDGNITRCNFIKDYVANIYEDSFAEQLKPRPCSNATCRCYIGYIHLDALKLEESYNGLWERMPRLLQKNI